MRTTTDGNGSVPRHLEDVDLISYLDGELERAEQEFARTHLEGCWSCRSHLLAVQNSIESFLRARKQVLPSELPPSGVAMAQFRRRLTEHASAPVSARLGLRLGQWLRSFVAFPDVTLIRTYKKTALASAVAVIALIFVLLDPFKWNAVSADELLTRASAYEFLNERPQGKILRQRARFVRINQTTKTETDLGQVETDADSLSSALHVSIESASHGARRETLPDRDKPSADFFREDFTAETALYLRSQGWLPQVSTSLYQRLIAGRGRPANDGATVARYDNFYQLHHPFATDHQSHITEAVLTLNAADYAPHSISIITVENSERYEYRLTRTSIEAEERTADLAQLFETAKSMPPTARELETRNPKPATENTETPNSKLETSLAASADLEVEVLRLLHQAGADLGEQISVKRTGGGPVRVTGIVETDQRKAQILAALNPVVASPAVQIEIQTVAEAIARQKSPSSSRPAIAERVEIQNTGIAAEPELRAYFERRTANTEAAVRQFAAGMVGKSGSGMQHLGAMRRLVNQFSPEQLRNLTPGARGSWLSLLRSHARAYQQQSAAMRRDLKPVFFAGAGDDLPGAPAILSDEELRSAVQELFSAGFANDQVIRSAFTVTNQGARFTAIGTPQFWNSLKRAESLAAAISKQ